MKLKFIPEILSKYGKLTIVSCWLFTTVLYLKMFGVVTNLEAEKYISEAVRFINTGTFSATRYWFYCITIFIIVIALKIKIGLTGAFILQSLLNLYAYLFFYNELKKVFQFHATALFIVLYLLLFGPYQSWVVYLFTESAFFSVILILFAVLVRYKPDSIKNISILCTALFLVVVSRPLGILFTASCYAYLFYVANKKWKIILAIFSILVFISAFYIINAIFSTIDDWSITKPFEQESIICNLPNENPSYTKLDLSTSGKPTYQLYYYITHNFNHFLHFAGIKLQYFFLMTRPYYSKAHNYFVLINNAIIYLLMVIGFFIKQIKFTKGLIIFLTTSIAIYTVTIIFQCDDYHNRFILSIFPFFVILSAGTVEFIVLRLINRSPKPSSPS